MGGNSQVEGDFLWVTFSGPNWLWIPWTFCTYSISLVIMTIKTN